MGTPHKHRDLIKAWAEGAEIQSRYYPPNKEQQIDWRAAYNPTWTTDSYVEYRIKPKTIKYRNYLWRSTTYKGAAEVVRVCSYKDNTEDPRENWAGFIKWLTDWQEVEV